jgi:cell wall-associated NlpC family hydrolase
MGAVPMRVRVPVATLWAAPDRPRGVDAAAVADRPDVVAWLSALDAHADDDADGDGRLGLHGRVDSQLVAGEPATVIGSDPAYPGWVQVVCPWQPSSLDARGYPGWLRTAHLEADDPPVRSPRDAAPADDALPLARRHLGLPYLWGGTSPWGLDCSGLVHLVHRQLGRVLPRDAHDQQSATDPVDPADADPGDLYFFARPGEPAHHVGIVTGAYRMIHASERRAVVEEALDDTRRATLSGAGRIPG